MASALIAKLVRLLSETPAQAGRMSGTFMRSLEEAISKNPDLLANLQAAAKTAIGKTGKGISADILQEAAASPGPKEAAKAAKKLAQELSSITPGGEPIYSIWGKEGAIAPEVLKKLEGTLPQAEGPGRLAALREARGRLEAEGAFTPKEQAILHNIYQGQPTGLGARYQEELLKQMRERLGIPPGRRAPAIPKEAPAPPAPGRSVPPSELESVAEADVRQAVPSTTVGRSSLLPEGIIGAIRKAYNQIMSPQKELPMMIPSRAIPPKRVIPSAKPAFSDVPFPKEQIEFPFMQTAEVPKITAFKKATRGAEGYVPSEGVDPTLTELLEKIHRASTEGQYTPLVRRMATGWPEQ